MYQGALEINLRWGEETKSMAAVEEHLLLSLKMWPAQESTRAWKHWKLL